MNAYLKNSLLIAAVTALVILPLILHRQSPNVSGGKTVEQFKGTDSQAAAVIQNIAPDYKPWFHSIIKPPSGKTENLLFAMQAAAGAGFIGYYFWYSRRRSRKISAPPDIVREN